MLLAVFQTTGSRPLPSTVHFSLLLSDRLLLPVQTAFAPVAELRDLSWEFLLCREPGAPVQGRNCVQCVTQLYSYSDWYRAQSPHRSWCCRCCCCCSSFVCSAVCVCLNFFYFWDVTFYILFFLMKRFLLVSPFHRQMNNRWDIYNINNLQCVINVS